MGDATRQAQARHPEITTQPADAQAVAADYRSANNPGTAATAAAPTAAPEQGAQASASNATANTTAGPNMGQVNPANPWAPKQDTSKQDAWAKLSPEQQKWLGGADPTDPIILARMKAAVPDKAPAAAPAAAPAPAAPQGSAAGYAPAALTPQQQAQNVLQPGMNKVAESTGYDEVQRIMSIVQYR